MRTTLVFETIVEDRLHLEKGKILLPSYRLFTPDDDGIDDNVTEMHEESILKFFMTSRAASFLFNHLGLPLHSHCLYSVKEPLRKNVHHPDFDLVIYETEKPENSTAIQCKRVKVTAINEAEDKVNKLSDVKQIVKQVNIQRREYGFHQNYLALIIQTFGRNRQTQNALFRHAAEKTFKEIYEFPERESVHEDVGIIFIRVTQPTGRSYKEKVSVGFCLNKPANRLAQTTELTNRIKELTHRRH